MASTKLFTHISSFEIGHYDEFTHLPQLINLNLPVPCNQLPEELDSKQTLTKTNRLFFKWTQDSYDKLLHSDNLAAIAELIENNDIDRAIWSFNNMIQEACIQKKSNKKRKHNKTEWWDSDMDILKAKKYRCLRHLRNNPCESTLRIYRNLRKEYKSKIKEKKEQLRDKNRKLVENCRSPSDFWKFIKSKSEKKSCLNNISSNDWKIYFKELLNSKNCVNDPTFDEQINDFVLWHDSCCNVCMSESVNVNDKLDSDISVQEVEDALNKVVNGKMPGLDGITNDILKHASIIVVPLLCKIFNKVLEPKYFPREWGNALIIPLHKKGSRDNPDNYRGIALLSCVGKNFTKILNNRLNDWAEENDKMYDIQAGFQKGKSTIDQIFIFQSIISKYISKKKGRFYSVFIDFSKAFDSIPHLHLFYSLLQENLHGRIFCVLRNMYDKLYSCIQSTDGSISTSFKCEIGTRQGCIISPFLFICYLNEFIKQVNKSDCKGIFVNDQNQCVNMLLYADDMVLFGDNVGHVQKLLNHLSIYCKNGV